MKVFIIKRERLLKKIKYSLPQVIVYGRRKTGKTFLIKNFFNYDYYFFVGRDLRIFKSEDEILNYNEFFNLFKELIKVNKTIVIDEFHRLPKDFFDYLHLKGVNQNLILISSTTWLVKEMLNKNSPLLALFNQVLVSLIEEDEILRELVKFVEDKEELVEASVFLREPILIPFYKKNTKKSVVNYLNNNRNSIKSLILEIFNEEKKELSLIYESILKLIAEGKRKSTEMANELFSLGIIKKNNPGLLQRYLDNLREIGILRKIKVFNKKKFYYEHVSPLIDLHYFLESKYFYTENLVNESFILKVYEQKLPYYVEIFFRELLAKKEGLIFQKIEKPEIDISLFEFNKLKIIAEVKWKNEIKTKDIITTIEKFENFDCEKYFIVKDKTKIKEKHLALLKESNIRVVDIFDFLPKNL